MRFFSMGILSLMVLCLAGCASGPDQLSTPRIRVGGLPYPGLTNYLALEQPEMLGSHRYQRVRGWSDESAEESTSIVYTRHAGFIDLAHFRSTVDWVRYVYLVTLDRLMTPETAKQPPLLWSWLGMDYRLDIQPAQDWLELPDDQRRPLARDAAAVLAQRLAVSISTWHEIGSWYGQMIVPPILEVRSAFTWDDTSSHVLAALVGASALATSQSHNPQDWDRTVTRELAKAMGSLGPVDSACQNEALAASRGIWWYDAQTLRRDFDTGLQGPSAKRPWLVRGLSCADKRVAVADPVVLPLQLQLPGWRELEQSSGFELESWFLWDVTMPDWLTKRVLGCEGACTPHAFKGEGALLAAIDRIRKQVEKQSGPYASQPDGPAVTEDARKPEFSVRP